MNILTHKGDILATHGSLRNAAMAYVLLAILQNMLLLAGIGIDAPVDLLYLFGAVMDGFTFLCVGATLTLRPVTRSKRRGSRRG